jgi:hypothetical protein
MPPPLTPAIGTVSTEADSMEDVSMELVSAAGRPKPPVTPKRAPKMGAGPAWAAWQSTGAASAGSEFLQSVSSWMEGTAAQLLRRTWPVGAKRPTCMQVEKRLRYHLEVLAREEQATYLDALGAARRSVIAELEDARRLARAAAGGS